MRNLEMQKLSCYPVSMELIPVTQRRLSGRREGLEDT